MKLILTEPEPALFVEDVPGEDTDSPIPMTVTPLGESYQAA